MGSFQLHASNEINFESTLCKELYTFSKKSMHRGKRFFSTLEWFRSTKYSLKITGAHFMNQKKLFPFTGMAAELLDK